MQVTSSPLARKHNYEPAVTQLKPLGEALADHYAREPDPEAERELFGTTARPQFKIPTVQEIIEKLPAPLHALGNYYMTSSKSKNDVYSLVASIAFGASIVGRHYCTESGNYGNLFIIAAGPPGSGKGEARNAIKNTVACSKMPDTAIIGTYHSESAIATVLLERPSHLAIIDEFSGDLESYNAKNISSNTQSKLLALLSLFDVCPKFTPTYRSKIGVKKDSDEDKSLSIEIARPSISLLGFLQTEWVEKSMTPELVSRGWFSRFLFFRTNLSHNFDARMPKLGAILNMPKHSLAWIAMVWEEVRYHSLESGVILGADTSYHKHDSAAPPIVFSCDGSEFDDHDSVNELREYLKQCYNELLPLGFADATVRALQICNRLALIFACADRKYRDEPCVIKSSHIHLACMVTMYSCSNMMHICKKAQDGQYEKRVSSMVRTIKDLVDRYPQETKIPATDTEPAYIGIVVPFDKLSRNFRNSTRIERDQILFDLDDRGLLSFSRVARGSRVLMKPGHQAWLHQYLS